MATAIRIHEAGGPEQFKVEDIEVGDPAPGEVLIRHSAVVLNFIDIYQRSGLYPMALPTTLGMEAAGVVKAMGDGVTGLEPGDHIAYPMTGGAYCAARAILAEKVVKVPDSVDDQTAAAMMLKGMTVEYLLCRTFPIVAGQIILFHAAAGGVGLIACQWAKSIGATVIGTVSTDEKAEQALAHGCDHTLITGRDDIAERVKELTDGQGVPVVYDSIGVDTFEASLASLAPRGMLVSFGQSSGPVTSFNPAKLAAGGSLFYSRPSLANYIATREELELSAQRLFNMVGSGKVAINVNQTHPLNKTEQAHRDLEGRKTTGSTVLLP